MSKIRIWNGLRAAEVMAQAREAENKSYKQFADYKRHGSDRSWEASNKNAEKADRLFSAVESYLLNIDGKSIL